MLKGSCLLVEITLPNKKKVFTNKCSLVEEYARQKGYDVKYSSIYRTSYYCVEPQPCSISFDLDSLNYAKYFYENGKEIMRDEVASDEEMDQWLKCYKD